MIAHLNSMHIHSGQMIYALCYCIQRHASTMSHIVVHVSMCGFFVVTTIPSVHMYLGSLSLQVLPKVHTGTRQVQEKVLDSEIHAGSPP